MGTGRMGSALVRRLAALGYTVYAWNRTREKLRDLPAKPLNDLSEARGLVFIFVSDDEALYRVSDVTGEVVALAGTYSVDAVKALSIKYLNRGMGLLASPVIGGPGDVERGTAIYLVGGSETVFNKVSGVFKGLGEVIRLPSVESAMALKLAYNALLIGSMALLGEYLNLGMSYGVDNEVLKGVLTRTVFREIAEKYMDRILNPPQKPSFTLALATKDVKYAVRAGESSGTPLLISSAVKSLYELLTTYGFGNEDYVRGGFLEVKRS